MFQYFLKNMTQSAKISYGKNKILEDSPMEIITFLVLEDSMKFSDKLVKFIERDLAKELDIECKIMTANTLEEALQLKENFKVDIHVIDPDLANPAEDEIDYIKMVANDFDDDEPVLPMIIISEQDDDYHKLGALGNVIGLIGRSEFNEESALFNFKRAVKVVRRAEEKLITFVRPKEKRTYKEKNIWAVTKSPIRGKKMIVTIYDEETDQVIKEEFSLKKSLREVPALFSDLKIMVRCHKSYLVNPRAIIGQKGDQLLLPYGEKVPLGAEFVEDIPY